MRTSYYYLWLCLFFLPLNAQEREEEEESVETVAFIPDDVPAGHILIKLKDKATDRVIEAFVAPWSFINASSALKGLMEFVGITKRPNSTSTFDLYSDTVSPEAINFFKYIFRNVGTTGENSYKSLIALFVNESDIQASIEGIRAVDFIGNEFLLGFLLSSLKDKLIEFVHDNRWNDVRVVIMQLANLQGVAHNLAHIIIDYLCNESPSLKKIMVSLKRRKPNFLPLHLAIGEVVFDSSKNWLVAIPESGKILIYRLRENEKPLYITSIPFEGFKKRMKVFAPYKPWFVTCHNKQLNIFSFKKALNPQSDDDRNPVLLRTIDLRPFSNSDVKEIFFSANGEFLFVHQNEQLIRYSLKKMLEDEKTTENIRIRYQGKIGESSFIVNSPYDKDLLAFVHDKKIRLYNKKSQSVEHTIYPKIINDAAISDMKFSYDGRKFAWAQENSIKVLDLDTYEELYSLEGDVPPPSSYRFRPYFLYKANLCFSHDNKWLLSGYFDTFDLTEDSAKDRTVKIWDMATGELLTQLDPRPSSKAIVHNIHGISISPDDKAIAYVDQKNYRDSRPRIYIVPFPFDCDRLQGLPLQSIMLLWYCLESDADDTPIKFLEEQLPDFNALPKELRDYFIQKNRVKDEQAFVVELLEQQKAGGSQSDRRRRALERAMGVGDISQRVRERRKKEREEELEGAGKGKKRQRTEEPSIQRRRRYEPEPKHRARKKERE
jgi:WD40 repeat protein